MSEETTSEQQKEHPLYKKGWADAKEDRGSATVLLFVCVTFIAAIIWVMFGIMTYQLVGESEYERGVAEVQNRAVDMGVGDWKVTTRSGSTKFYWIVEDTYFNYDHEYEADLQRRLDVTLGGRGVSLEERLETE